VTTMRTITSILSLLLLTACAGAPPPRVTTPEERADAEAGISWIEVAVTAMHAAGRLGNTPEKNDARFALAKRQIAEVRDFVEATSTVPVRESTVAAKILTLGLEWGVQPRN